MVWTKRRLDRRLLRPRIMLTRRVKLLLIGAVITLGLLATILVDAPAPTMTVDELIAEASDCLLYTSDAADE